MPIIAAVGSFWISERILKPKVTALFVLACLAIYDVFVSPPKPIIQSAIVGNITAHAAVGGGDRDKYLEGEHGIQSIDEFWDYDHHLYDAEQDDLATSMRCYRGPALLALALFCGAYSLRIWRRNGVAVDELIFLPGAPHEFRLTGGEQKSAPGNNIENSGGGEGGEAGNNSTTIVRGSGPAEGTAAASPIQGCYSEGDADAAAGAARPSAPLRPHSLSHGDVRTMDFNITSSGVVETPHVERQPLMLDGSNSAPSRPSSLMGVEDSPMAFIRDQAMKGIDMLVIRKPLRPPPLQIDDDTASGESSSTLMSPNEVYDAEYAPSAPSVLGAALDLSLPALFNFHMFCVLMKGHYKKEADSAEDGDHQVGDGGKFDIKDYVPIPEFTPKVLPFFFLTPLLIRSMVPPRQRRRFYKTLLQSTILSPFKPVRFRDAFVADCVTSLVRPIVDVTYVIAYYWTTIFGFLSGKFTFEQSGIILSRSMIMHGLVLPALSILPLVMKFLQSLRQAHDTGKRLPYLGNTFKYGTAMLVILYGMTHAAGERSPWWVSAFVLATIYQIVWDVFIDWELLVIVPRQNEHCRKRPGSAIANMYRRGRDKLDQLRLRPKRLFDDDSFYWKALFANAALRFCWMAGFIPAYWVNYLDGSTQVTFVDKAHGWSFVLLATLEIVRRTIWGIIKLELETIKLTSGGESDLTMASTADEYIREGKFNVPSSAMDVSKNWRGWRCRSNNAVRPKAYSRLEQTEHLEEEQQPESALSLETSKSSPELQTHRLLCFSVSSGFLRWLFVVELLLWPCVFLVLSYYVVLSE